MNSNSIGVWDTPESVLGPINSLGNAYQERREQLLQHRSRLLHLSFSLMRKLKKSFKPSGLLDKAIGISDNYDSSWIFANFPEEEWQQPICFSWYARVPFSHTFHHFPPCKEAENLIVKCSSAASDQESVMKANNNSWYTTQHFSW
jgi:hypothetical protein